jgi:hypothetical protein
MLALAGRQSLDIRGRLEVFALASPQAQEHGDHEPLDDRACCRPTGSRSNRVRGPTAAWRRPSWSDVAGCAHATPVSTSGRRAIYTRRGEA